MSGHGAPEASFALRGLGGQQRSITLPADVRRRYHLDEPGAQVEVIGRSDGVIELHPVLPHRADQAWCCTDRWQRWSVMPGSSSPTSTARPPSAGCVEVRADGTVPGGPWGALRRALPTSGEPWSSSSSPPPRATSISRARRGRRVCASSACRMPRRVGDDMELCGPRRASHVRVDRAQRRARHSLASCRRPRDLLRSLTPRDRRPARRADVHPPMIVRPRSAK